MKTTSLFLLLTAASVPTFALPVEDGPIEKRQGDDRADNRLFGNESSVATPTGASFSTGSGRVPSTTASSIQFNNATASLSRALTGTASTPGVTMTSTPVPLNNVSSSTQSEPAISESESAIEGSKPATQATQPFFISPSSRSSAFTPSQASSTPVSTATSNDPEFDDDITESSHEAASPSAFRNPNSTKKPSSSASASSFPKIPKSTPKASTATGNTRQPISSAAALRSESSKAVSTTTTTTTAVAANAKFATGAASTAQPAKSSSTASLPSSDKCAQVLRVKMQIAEMQRMGIPIPPYLAGLEMGLKGIKC